MARRAIIASVVKKIQENDSSSSESSEDELLEFCSQRKRMCLRARVENYVELTVNLYSDSDFQSHFRLTRATFQFLLEIFGEQLIRTIKGNQQIDPEKQLLIAIWRMGNTESYRSICDRFNVSKSTAHLCVSRVTKALVLKINMFIKWPSAIEANKIKRGFEASSSFPDTIGAIDGTHIEIEAPKDNPEDYLNRKGYASIQLQAVCNNTRVFTHVFVGFPGSTHDQRVFRNSPIESYLNDDTKFPGNTHLVGDAAYSLHPKLLTPFKDNGHLSVKQKNFNFCLSSARVTIERSFGLLKGRWRSLLNCLPMKNVRRMPNYIAACCILHNICLIRSDDMDITLETNNPASSLLAAEMQERGADYQDGESKRNLIMNKLHIRHI